MATKAQRAAGLLRQARWTFHAGMAALALSAGTIMALPTVGIACLLIQIPLARRFAKQRREATELLHEHLQAFLD